MKKKQDEQNSKIEKLSRASEWIQAHWRGMLARKEMEKARKGKKKKKKKKWRDGAPFIYSNLN